jgi:hypothetical protein
VDGEGTFDRPYLVEKPVVEHGRGTGVALFPWLEHEHDPTRQRGLPAAQ